jgi:GntR family transcriptional regulator/MocR family aminotransferase
MFPALRLGFVVAPEWAMRALVTAKNCADWHCPMPLQGAVAAFINEGHLTRHVRRMRGLYRQRRDLMLDVLGEKMSAWLAPIPSSYGMHITAKAVAPIDCDRLAEALQVRGVTLHSLGRYYLGPQSTAGLVLNYGCVDPAGLRRGLSALCRVLRSLPDAA